MRGLSATELSSQLAVSYHPAFFSVGLPRSLLGLPILQGQLNSYFLGHSESTTLSLKISLHEKGKLGSAQGTLYPKTSLQAISPLISVPSQHGPPRLEREGKHCSLNSGLSTDRKPSFSFSQHSQGRAGFSKPFLQKKLENHRSNPTHICTLLEKEMTKGQKERNK